MENSSVLGWIIGGVIIVGIIVAIVTTFFQNAATALPTLG